MSYFSNHGLMGQKGGPQSRREVDSLAVIIPWCSNTRFIRPLGLCRECMLIWSGRLAIHTAFNTYTRTCRDAFAIAKVEVESLDLERMRLRVTTKETGMLGNEKIEETRQDIVFSKGQLIRTGGMDRKGA